MVGVRAAIFNSDGRICCVRHGYGATDWNAPGGGIEQSESPIDALRREVLEETGFTVEIRDLIGLYSVPAQSGLVVWFHAEITSEQWREPDGEIMDHGFFGREDLPNRIHPCVYVCLMDAFDKKRGIVRVLHPDGTSLDTRTEPPGRDGDHDYSTDAGGI